jgi:hypothetical protein
MNDARRIPATSKREIWIAAIVGAILVCFLVLGVVSMSKRTAGGSLRGTIVAKHFIPEPQDQITIGRDGVHGRRIQGEYVFEVNVPPQNRTYRVWVDEKIYAAREVGDQFMFPRPARTPD